MTLGCTDIEAILDVCRSDPYRSTPLPLPGSGWRPEAWKDVIFTETWDEPLQTWLGNTDAHDDRAEALACMNIVPMIGFLNAVPQLARGPAWNLIEHQTAGNACHHPKIIGHFVRLKPQVHAVCLAIARELFDSQIGWYGPSLDDLTTFSKKLSAVGLRCKYFDTFRHLQEGLYPAEIDQATADLIMEDNVVLADLLLEPDKSFNISRMSFFFIASNSD